MKSKILGLIFVEVLRDFVCDWLILKGYDVKVSENKEVFLNILETFTPDIILMDIMMPEVIDMDLYKKIKENTKVAQSPIIFLTGFIDDAMNETMLKVGGVGYLLKPIRLNKLEDMVKRGLTNE